MSEPYPWPGRDPAGPTSISGEAPGGDPDWDAVLDAFQPEDLDEDPLPEEGDFWIERDDEGDTP